tara:strand:+ start:72040 stop:72582 length:543 start_codon:yes stop_codon:yes gene_type:complete
MRLIRIPIVLLFLFLFLNSCVDNLNFDDTDLSLAPVFTSPLISFNLNQNDFFDEVNNVDNLEIDAIVGDFTILQSDGVRDNLTRLQINMEISSQFSRGITITISFEDDFGNVTFTDPSFVVFSGDNFKHEINIFTSSDPLFLTSKKIRFNVRMTPSITPLDPSVSRSFELKSTGTYYLNI